MSKALATYDSDLTWSIHVVEVLVQHGEYSRVFRYEVRGNVTGWDSMDDAPDSLQEDWFFRDERGEKIDGVVIDDDYIGVTLENGRGDTLEIEIWETRELERLITAVRIVEVRPYDREVVSS